MFEISFSDKEKCCIFRFKIFLTINIFSKKIRTTSPPHRSQRIINIFGNCFQFPLIVFISESIFYTLIKNPIVDSYKTLFKYMMSLIFITFPRICRLYNMIYFNVYVISHQKLPPNQFNLCDKYLF